MSITPASKVARRFHRAPSAPPQIARPAAERLEPPVTLRLESLATAAMALGWSCVQAADEGLSERRQGLGQTGLPVGFEPGAMRPGTHADWRRFDLAWSRVRRELPAQDLAGLGLALLDFAQACRITADRLVEHSS